MNPDELNTLFVEIAPRLPYLIVPLIVLVIMMFVLNSATEEMREDAKENKQTVDKTIEKAQEETSLESKNVSDAGSIEERTLKEILADEDVSHGMKERAALLLPHFRGGTPEEHAIEFKNSEYELDLTTMERIVAGKIVGEKPQMK